MKTLIHLTAYIAPTALIVGVPMFTLLQRVTESLAAIQVGGF